MSIPPAAGFSLPAVGGEISFGLSRIRAIFRYDGDVRCGSGRERCITSPLRFKTDAIARSARPEPICPDRPYFTSSFQKSVEEATLG